MINKKQIVCQSLRNYQKESRGVSVYMFGQYFSKLVINDSIRSGLNLSVLLQNDG